MVNNDRYRTQGRSSRLRREETNPLYTADIRARTERQYRTGAACADSASNAPRENECCRCSCTETCANENRSSSFDTTFAPGISYVPWQKWSEPMCAADGLRHGTIFRELVKPFLGKEKTR